MYFIAQMVEVSSRLPAYASLGKNRVTEEIRVCESVGVQ